MFAIDLLGATADPRSMNPAPEARLFVPLFHFPSPTKITEDLVAGGKDNLVMTTTTMRRRKMTRKFLSFF